MTKQIPNIRSEKLWRSIPKDLQIRILNAVWCTNCKKGTKIADWTIGVRDDLVIIDGQCSVCGGKCARVLEET